LKINFLRSFPYWGFPNLQVHSNLASGYKGSKIEKEKCLLCWLPLNAGKDSCSIGFWAKPMLIFYYLIFECDSFPEFIWRTVGSIIFLVVRVNEFWTAGFWKADILLYILNNKKIQSHK
jgi:hypothetical protein